MSIKQKRIGIGKELVIINQKEFYKTLWDGINSGSRVLLATDSHSELMMISTQLESIGKKFIYLNAGNWISLTPLVVNGMYNQYQVFIGLTSIMMNYSFDVKHFDLTMVKFNTMDLSPAESVRVYSCNPYAKKIHVCLAVSGKLDK